MLTLLQIFLDYCWDVIPALIFGFLLSGIIHVLVPEKMVQKHLGEKGIKPILYSTIIGAIVPVCCWGSLPIAISFYRRGASIGPILALLIATPATSVNAFIVTAKLMGLGFSIFLSFGVIVMAIVVGLIADKLDWKVMVKREKKSPEKSCSSCHGTHEHAHKKESKIAAILKYAFIELPKDLGPSLLLAMALAAIIKFAAPVGYIINHYLYGVFGYIFSILFSLLTYMCATMSVPFVEALVSKGLAWGPALIMLMIGPITSYGTILVLRREFGIKLLGLYLGLIVLVSLCFGLVYGFMANG